MCLDPAMDGGHQSHRPEPSQEQAEGIALVVVTVPDRDLLASADCEQLCDDAPVPRAAIGDGNEGYVSVQSALSQDLEPGIRGRMQVGADVAVAHRFQEPWRVQDGLVGAASGSRDDTNVENHRQLRRVQVRPG